MRTKFTEDSDDGLVQVRSVFCANAVPTRRPSRRRFLVQVWQGDGCGRSPPSKTPTTDLFKGGPSVAPTLCQRGVLVDVGFQVDRDDGREETNSGGPYELLMVVATTRQFLTPFPYPGPSKPFRFLGHPNFCLAVYKPDRRHTTEQILFYRVTPIWDILCQTTTIFCIVYFI